MLREINDCLHDCILQSRTLMRVCFWLRGRRLLKRSGEINLHLGCGNVAKPGFINIDIRKTRATDFVADIGMLPFPDSSVDRIESYHVIEHLSHTRVKRVLLEWHRILRRGGQLVIECPDFDAAVREYLAGNDQRLFNVFGLHRFKGDIHLFGYNEKRLKLLLETNGFEGIKSGIPTDYHVDEEPCLRIESRKSLQP